MTNGKCFDDLPNEIVAHIFTFLDLEDLALSVPNVNARWREISQVDEIWKHRIFESSEEMNDEEKLNLLRNLPALRSYYEISGGDTESIIDTLCIHCKKLTVLRLVGCHVLNYDLMTKVVRSLSNIKELKIPILKQEDPLSSANLIGELPKLTNFKFSDRYAEMSTGVLIPFADKCPSLKHMDLGDNKFVDEDVRYFLQKKCQQLLSFGVQCYISTSTFHCIPQCPNLEKLLFWTYDYASNLALDDFLLLRELKKLRELCFGHFSERLAKSVPNLFQNQFLSSVIKLKLYNFIYGFDEKDLSQLILNCPQLTYFSVCCTAVLEVGLIGIGNCRQLEYLGLSGCTYITNKCLDLVAEACPKLRYLDLSCTMDTNDDLILSVLKFKELRVLLVSYSMFTGKYFDLFPIHLKNLREIVAYELYCDEGTWDFLHERMPHLKITKESW